MAKVRIHDAVADALRAMDVAVVTIDLSHRHPRVLWDDAGKSGQKGIITVPGTSGDRRALLNNITMARRIVRAAREG